MRSFILSMLLGLALVTPAFAESDFGDERGFGWQDRAYFGQSGLELGGGDATAGESGDAGAAAGAGDGGSTGGNGDSCSQ